MNTSEVFALTCVFTQLVTIMQENQTGGVMAIALMACMLAMLKSSGK